MRTQVLLLVENSASLRLIIIYPFFHSRQHSLRWCLSEEGSGLWLGSRKDLIPRNHNPNPTFKPDHNFSRSIILGSYEYTGSQQSVVRLYRLDADHGGRSCSITSVFTLHGIIFSTDTRREVYYTTVANKDTSQRYSKSYTDRRSLQQ